MDTRAGSAVPSLLDFYLLSWRLGIRTLLSRRELRMGLARLVNPLSYPRYMEYHLALRGLQIQGGMSVLDIGSPKLLSVLLGSKYDIDLWITDLRDYFIPSTRMFLELTGCGPDVGRRMHLETQDARSLTYDSAAFDRIFAVSVVEHIPDAGDGEAMAEMARVLKPGGVVALTVPFAAAYVEEMVAEDVYERHRQGQELVFFQRRYDDEALRERLITPSGLEVLGITYFGEPVFRFEPLWNRIPLALRLPVLWTAPILARMLLRELPAGNHDAAVGAALVLRKPPSGS